MSHTQEVTVLDLKMSSRILGEKPFAPAWKRRKRPPKGPS